MRTAAMICAALIATGCATRQEMVWTKPGASYQEFNQDLGQCRAQAFGVASGNLMQIAIVQNSCLQGKGWYQVPAN